MRCLLASNRDEPVELRVVPEVRLAVMLASRIWISSTERERERERERQTEYTHTHHTDIGAA